MHQCIGVIQVSRINFKRCFLAKAKIFTVAAKLKYVSTRPLEVGAWSRLCVNNFTKFNNFFLFKSIWDHGFREITPEEPCGAIVWFYTVILFMLLSLLKLFRRMLQHCYGPQNFT